MTRDAGTPGFPGITGAQDRREAKAMKVRNKDEAWEVAGMIFPTDYALDEERTQRAGYPIWYSTADGVNAWISDLGCRLELNLPSGKSVNVWIKAETEEKGIATAVLLRYLQSQMDDFKKNEKRYGIGDRAVMKKLDAMIACKEMVEAVIQEPVNLRQDGTITVGF